MTELFFWRQRMAKFNSVTQQVLAYKICIFTLSVYASIARYCYYTVLPSATECR